MKNYLVCSIAVFFFAVCNNIAFGQSLFEETPLFTVYSTIYDDGIAFTSGEDPNGSYVSLMKNTGGVYEIETRFLEGQESVSITTGISTSNFKLFPLAVSTVLVDGDSTDLEFIGSYFPSGDRNQSKVAIWNQSGSIIYESQAGCEFATKFFGDDGTVSFQNKGKDIVRNPSGGSVLNIACTSSGITEFKGVHLQGSIPCCCDLPGETTTITSIVAEEDHESEAEVWVSSSGNLLRIGSPIYGSGYIHSVGGSLMREILLNEGENLSWHNFSSGVYTLTVGNTNTKFVIP